MNLGPPGSKADHDDHLTDSILSFSKAPLNAKLPIKNKKLLHNFLNIPRFLTQSHPWLGASLRQLTVTRGGATTTTTKTMTRDNDDDDDDDDNARP